MQLEAVRSIAMRRILGERLGQVDDIDGLEGALCKTGSEQGARSALAPAVRYTAKSRAFLVLLLTLHADTASDAQHLGDEGNLRRHFDLNALLSHANDGAAALAFLPAQSRQVNAMREAG